jgi:hypothetical protein
MNPHLLTQDDFLDRFQPIGRNKARELLHGDPRAPKPIIGGAGGNTRIIYSKRHVDQYFTLVEAEGFPHFQGGAE